MVAYAYNLSYSGGLWFKASPGQKVSKTPISTNNLFILGHACDPSYQEAWVGGSWYETGPGLKT
jgi:hypothetical protein